jgi:hypothetical protein
MTTKDKLIEKQKDFYLNYKVFREVVDEGIKNTCIVKMDKLKSEIASLESELAKEQEQWKKMTPIERMEAKGLIDHSYKSPFNDDEVDDTLLGLDGEETWLP